VPVDISYKAVVEIERPTANGITQPYFCRLQGGETHIVKGKYAGFKGLIAETVSALLGRSMGLPIPDFAIAEINSGLLTFNKEAASSLGAGLTFASKYQPGLFEMTPSMLDHIPKATLQHLYVFDHWIQNEDRTGTDFGGNANLFLQADTHELVVIDHNLAFAATFDPSNNASMHICKNAWFEGAGDLLMKDYLIAQMDVAFNGIQGYEDALPPAWLDGAPGFTDSINHCLTRYQSNAFWEELKP
jgi:hypothetical protein